MFTVLVENVVGFWPHDASRSVRIATPSSTPVSAVTTLPLEEASGEVDVTSVTSGCKIIDPIASTANYSSTA
jgi:hypothetical protein